MCDYDNGNLLCQYWKLGNVVFVKIIRDVVVLIHLINNILLSLVWFVGVGGMSGAAYLTEVKLNCIGVWCC